MKAPILSLSEFELKCWEYFYGNLGNKTPYHKIQTALQGHSTSIHTYNLLLNTKVEKDHFVRPELEVDLMKAVKGSIEKTGYDPVKKQEDWQPYSIVTGKMILLYFCV